MDRTAIEKIVEIAEPHIIEENGFTYTDKDLDVVREPKVRTIDLKTLSSLVKLIKLEENTYNSPVIIRVTTPTVVDVFSGISISDRSREEPYSVKAEVAEFNFGQWYSYERMMIALRSKFVETPELLELVQLLGTITEENNMQIADDGFTQTVTVRKGVVLKDNKVVKPRVKLIPFSTFSEVKQPERELLLRLDGSGSVALFEADGGAWKLEARKNIADYLKSELEDVKSVTIVE